MVLGWLDLLVTGASAYLIRQRLLSCCFCFTTPPKLLSFFTDTMRNPVKDIFFCLGIGLCAIVSIEYVHRLTNSREPDVLLQSLSTRYMAFFGSHDDRIQVN